MRIEKGKQYECTRTIDNPSENEVYFVKGKVYLCEVDGRLADEYKILEYIPAVWASDYFKLYVKNPVTDHVWVNPDPINPAHYKYYSVETIDMMVAIYGKEKVAIHCELTAFKYRMRAGKKDSLEQDLAKEKWYLDKAKELRNED